jgi:hypothetical protein
VPAARASGVLGNGARADRLISHPLDMPLPSGPHAAAGSLSLRSLLVVARG